MLNLNESDRLPPEKERELILKAANGDLESRDILVVSNMRLVYKIANSFQGYGMDKDDLVSEGGIALFKAIEKFNPFHFGEDVQDLGAIFSAFIGNGIRFGIQTAIRNQADMIRRPSHIRDKTSKIFRAERDLNRELGRVATDQEIAEKTCLSVDQVGKYKKSKIDVFSLDCPLDSGDERGATLGDILEDENGECASNTLIENERFRNIEPALKQLASQDQVILRSYFGFQCDGMTVLEIAAKMGVSRQAVDQRLKIILRKFKCILGSLEAEIPTKEEVLIEIGYNQTPTKSNSKKTSKRYRVKKIINRIQGSVRKGDRKECIHCRQKSCHKFGFTGCGQIRWRCIKCRKTHSSRTGKPIFVVKPEIGQQVFVYLNQGKSLRWIAKHLPVNRRSIMRLKKLKESVPYLENNSVCDSLNLLVGIA